MVDTQRDGVRLEGDGLVIIEESAWHAAALRYFDAAGPVAALLLESTRQGIPAPLRGVEFSGPSGGAPSVLAWRSPSETLYLTRDALEFADLEQRFASMTDGCMVDQTGGIRIVRVTGPRAWDLLRRLAAESSIPPAGHAYSGRWAEVNVLAVCLHPQEFLLSVDRVYAEHLLHWIKATLADFGA